MWRACILYYIVPSLQALGICGEHAYYIILYPVFRPWGYVESMHTILYCTQSSGPGDMWRACILYYIVPSLQALGICGEHAYYIILYPVFRPWGYVESMHTILYCTQSSGPGDMWRACILYYIVPSLQALGICGEHAYYIILYPVFRPWGYVESMHTILYCTQSSGPGDMWRACILYYIVPSLQALGICGEHAYYIIL